MNTEQEIDLCGTVGSNEGSVLWCWMEEDRSRDVH